MEKLIHSKYVSPFVGKPTVGGYTAVSPAIVEGDLKGWKKVKEVY